MVWPVAVFYSRQQRAGVTPLNPENRIGVHPQKVSNCSASRPIGSKNTGFYTSPMEK